MNHELKTRNFFILSCIIVEFFRVTRDIFFKVSLQNLLLSISIFSLDFLNNESIVEIDSIRSIIVHLIINLILSAQRNYIAYFILVFYVNTWMLRYVRSGIFPKICWPVSSLFLRISHLSFYTNITYVVKLFNLR